MTSSQTKNNTKMMPKRININRTPSCDRQSNQWRIGNRYCNGCCACCSVSGMLECEDLSGLSHYNWPQFNCQWLPIPPLTSRFQTDLAHLPVMKLRVSEGKWLFCFSSTVLGVVRDLLQHANKKKKILFIAQTNKMKQLNKIRILKLT